MQNNFSFSRWLLTLLCAMFLSTACSKEPAMTGLSLTGYNHTEEGISSYSVEVEGGAEGGSGFIAPGAGGGGFTCCVSVPVVWRPGIKVTVKKIVTRVKKTTAGEKYYDIETKHVTTLPKYEKKDMGHFDVHFLYNGDVKVFVTMLTLGHRKYPLAGKEAEMKPGVPLEITWE